MTASQGALPGGTVLVVEDDFLIADLICTLLESAGYSARHAGDGAEALAHVEAGGIELVLLDLMLPGINGFEVCRRVRARPEPVYLPIIMLTALQSPMDRAAGFAAGADDYLTKPFDADALLERLAVWVRTRRRLQAAEAARKQLEDLLRQAQKLDAVGRLAGGIAHDFNNLLTVISGCSELLQRELPPDDAARQYVAEISRAGARAAELTHRLLAFSRQQVLQPRVVDLNEIVADTQTLLRRLIGENIEVLAGLRAAQPTVQVDPGQIQQVIVNLAVNARDAMPDGGKLTIETADLVLGADYVQEHFDVQPGSYVLLAVCDTGCGMDAETLAQVFEPFFTTKAPEKGTGLGLSMVYGIVKQSGGYIWVYSEPGHGTAVKIYLPRVAESIVSRTPQPVIAPMPRGTETILLVEDEDQVRGLAATVLRQCGYQVLEATRGDEGLSRGQQHRGPIDLLLTDVVMPGFNGRDLARQLMPTRPDMRVLFISGYTDDVVVHHGVLEEGIAFLQKPFTADTLARRVREALDVTGQAATPSQSPGASSDSTSVPPSAPDRKATQDFRPTGVCRSDPRSP